LLAWKIDPIRQKLLVLSLSNFLQRRLANDAVVGPGRHLDDGDQLGFHDKIRLGECRAAENFSKSLN